MQLLKRNLQSTIKLSIPVHPCWQHSMSSQDVSIRHKGTSMNSDEKLMFRKILQGMHLAQAIKALSSLAQYCANCRLSQTQGMSCTHVCGHSV